MTNPEPVVTWEHFCQVTALNVELLKDNRRLREQQASDHKTIFELFDQRQELFDQLTIHGLAWPEWAGKPMTTESGGTVASP